MYEMTNGKQEYKRMPAIKPSYISVPPAEKEV